jgi:hypothetical protein
MKYFTLPTQQRTGILIRSYLGKFIPNTKQLSIYGYWDCSFSTLTRLWDGTPRTQEPNTHNIHTDSGSHPVPFKIGTMGFSREDAASRGQGC